MSRDAPLVELLGRGLAHRVRRVPYYLDQYMDPTLLTPIRDSYLSLAIQTSHEAWSAHELVRPPEDIPRAERLPAAMARARIAFWLSSGSQALRGRNDATAERLAEAADVWLDDAAHLARLMRQTDERRTR